MMTDPIADMLTRIRNAKAAYKKTVAIPQSKMKEQIAKKLKQEGFVSDYEVLQVEGAPCATLSISLKYGPDGEQVIRELHRVSKPGRRVYKNVSQLEKVVSGLGISILSTSKGLLTDRECHQQKTGGEVVCVVW